VYVGVGVAIAASHHYQNPRLERRVPLAVFLWPILLGINLHVKK
jgi:hypothetical protein